MHSTVFQMLSQVLYLYECSSLIRLSENSFSICYNSVSLTTISTLFEEYEKHAEHEMHWVVHKLVISTFKFGYFMEYGTLCGILYNEIRAFRCLHAESSR